MIRAMRTAASGMRAQQMNVDNIANNLANVNTTGFKKSRIEFQDLFYQQTRAAALPATEGTAAPTGLEVGYGALPVSTQRMWTQGEMEATGNPTDLAIMGDGFFRIQMPDGREAYTRDGSFKVSPDGMLVTSDGYPLSPEIVLPQDTKAISIAADGTLSVTLAADSTPQTVGQIELVRFVNPAGLSAQGQNLYVETPNSGQPLSGTATSEGYGRLQQGQLEVSNVEVIDEMIGLITAQRAYEINSKAIKASDDMLGMTNELAR
jgi:flagellar basal-body rod protein FlgG